MLARLVLALVVAIVVGLGFTYLLGPILVSMGLPLAVIVGEFFARWGWVLGICAGIWFYFSGAAAGWTWPWQRPPAA